VTAGAGRGEGGALAVMDALKGSVQARLIEVLPDNRVAF
jgi:hypothetical protein